MSISDIFIRRPVFTVMVAITISLFGGMCYHMLPVNDLPDIPSPVIQVNVNYPGASPVTMANNIATPLEKQFLQIEGIKLITSSSTQGQTSLNLEFNLTKNINTAATDVQTAITEATGQLPADLPSPPTYKKTNPNDQPIMYIGLTSQTQTLGQLYELASTAVGQRISVLPGVSNVQVFGAPPAVRIKANPTALAARHLTVQDLSAAIVTGTQYQGAGQFDGDQRTFLLNPLGQLTTADDYRNLVIGYAAGQAVYLRDVAEVKESTSNERLDVRFLYKGAPPNSQTVVLAVTKQGDANAVEVAKNVNAILPNLELLMPGSSHLFTIYDRSVSILESLDDVKQTLLISSVLVVAVIFVFLGRASDTLIPAIALPISLLMTMICMYLFHYTIDNLSLLALVLAIGFLVDDAIVFLENCVRRMEAGEDALTATFNSAKEISFTILSMTLSLAAVFIPLVFMPGQVGLIFREFGMVIIITVVCSGLVSLTITPLMCSRVLAERNAETKPTLVDRFMKNYFGRITRAYGSSLGFFLHHKWISITAWLLCATFTVYFIITLPRNFLPAGDSGFVRGVFVASQDASPNKMGRLEDKVSKVVQENPNVSVGVVVSGITGFLPSNLGGAFLFLKPVKDRPPIDAVIGQLTGALFHIPGIIPLFQANPVLQISTGATANSQGKYAFAISGLESAQVYACAGKMIGKMWQIPGMASVSSDMNLNQPQLQIHILRDRATTYGVTTQAIESVLRSAYSQNYIYLIKTENDQFQLIMEVDNRFRKDPENLALLYVKSVTGIPVPLSAVAEWTQTMGPQQVNHINQFSSVTIFFNLKPGTPIGDVTKQIETIGHDS